MAEERSKAVNEYF